MLDGLVGQQSTPHEVRLPSSCCSGSVSSSIQPRQHLATSTVFYFKLSYPYLCLPFFYIFGPLSMFKVICQSLLPYKRTNYPRTRSPRLLQYEKFA